MPDNNNNNNRKIARSEEDKEKQLQKIIDVGRELFIKKGRHGFTTRALARRCNMSQPNLYTYIESKRELWIAIRNQDWKMFLGDLKHIISQHQGSYIELFEKIFTYFLNFGKRNYKRFQMMFLIPPPPAKETGPFEKNYQPMKPLKLIRKVVKEAIEAGEFKKTDIDYLTYYLVGTAYGMAYIEREFRFNVPITEPIQEDMKPKDFQEFREFILEILRDQLEEL